MSNQSAKLLDAGNMLREVTHLVEVLSMATSDIDNERQQNALQSICNIVDDRIVSINALLDAARNAPAG
ncbi:MULTISPECIES: hypothetical protein [unclassified Phyllobacterium]|uniref:hypothetical protein n=1 Tax=Phyllobacterium TaxID=28100 RepID=UPI0013AF0299|nr:MULTISPECIES: hypothetical protein [unclassified Phyllobacterium]MBA8902870.1 hypothetical protein [Phyllobacterium sp. P30BS-XVII]UGX87613.1 hypothetical protein LLE53_007300 [Phyllobacterium sp. T1293]